MRLFFVLLFVSCGVFAMVDLGTVGKVYPVKEKSIKALLYERLEKLDVNRLKEQYLDAVDRAFEARVRLPESHKDIQKDTIDEIIATYNVPDPQHPGKILYPKGTRIKSELPEGAVLRMCFIDAKDKELAKEAASEFGKCDYLVANMDIRKIDFLEGNRVFPMGIPYIERFHVDALPLMLIMESDRIRRIYLDTRRLKKKIRERKNEI